MDQSTRTRGDARARIVDAAALLLQEQGAAAVTTRGVAEAAGVQAPAIYRLFGDKDGLLEAVAEHVLATYVAQKAAVVDEATAQDLDPLEDLRAGWQAQIAFGLANPGLFRLLSDPERALHSPAVQSGRRVLEARVSRLAAAGRLRVAEPRAVAMVQAAGSGAVLTLLATPAKHRDPALADAMLEAVLRQVLTDAPEPAEHAARTAAVALRAAAPQLGVLTGAEQQLLREWLDRVVDAP